MEIMTWDDQGDGIYVPVHQEPVDCPGDQEPEPHPEDCADCAGSGFTFEGGYRHLCLRSRLPAPHPPVDDPWASAPAYSAGDTRPF
ncbi:hypothetical protein GCM10009759_70980 [Kitasatospora saccharophila]|uniref:Uncharacterized protein n=1 Tax=Kitasatospora saccharophila TaxID=407973 RepID=A0ABP5JQN2_9ACTN